MSEIFPEIQMRKLDYLIFYVVMWLSQGFRKTVHREKLGNISSVVYETSKNQEKNHDKIFSSWTKIWNRWSIKASEIVFLNHQAIMESDV